MAAAKKSKPAASAAPKKPAQSGEGSKSPGNARSSGGGGETKKKAAQSKGKSRSHSDPDIYTDPALRDRLKEEVTAGDKGGKPGQWSARKAQLLASEYEKAGGDYRNGEQKKADSQKHLDAWTEEDWKTSDDQPAEREGGTTRYLPADAWDQLTPAQKKATNTKKQAGSKQGEQFVANTDAAKIARKAATESAAPSASPGETNGRPPARAKSKPKGEKAAPKSLKKSSD